MKKKLAIHLGYAPKGFRLPPQAIPPTVTSLFAEGLALHQAGRLADAERIYNQILAIRPDHFDSLHLLSVWRSALEWRGLLLAVRQFAAAAGVRRLDRRAVALAPRLIAQPKRPVT